MTIDDIEVIHLNMVREIEAVGGRIEGIFFSTDKNNDSFQRKPNPGMALQAVERFPGIDLSRSVMVGNKKSDVHFGRAAGMYTVFVTSTDAPPPEPHRYIDRVFPSLAAFASAL
jgi:histidinol phosphatase-like enzyme